MDKLQVILLNEKATTPTRTNKEDAGLDLYASENMLYDVGQTIVVPTAIAVNIPEGYVGLIRDRSSVATKAKLKITAGVIDAGYKGEVGVALVNMTGAAGWVKRGTKIAQLLIIPIETPEVEIVTSFEKESSRGVAGWGSSGT